MAVLLLGMILFLVAFAVHVVWWRTRTPHRQTRAMLVIFLLLPSGLLATLATLGPARSLAGIPLPSDPFAYLHIILCYSALALAYVTTAGEIEVDSPSLIMSLIIGRAGPQGITRRDLESILCDDVMVKPRLHDLVRDRMAVLEDGKYRVTPKGATLARLFTAFRSILQVSDKGG